MKYHQRGTSGQPLMFPRIFFLALFFSTGVISGHFFAGRVPVSTGQELEAYFRQYLLLVSDFSGKAVVSTFFLYMRYPLLAVLLGFSSAGMVLIPCLTFAFGFFLSFSVSCFAAAFGSSGILLAFAALGIRCIVTLPCFLILAEPAWEHAAGLAALSFGRGRRKSPVVLGRIFWARTVVCLIVLLLGVCTDLMVVPQWLHRALNRILI